MCYSGKCAYEDYMGNCTVSKYIKNICQEGRKKSKINTIKNILYSTKWLIVHSIKSIFSKKYRKEYKDKNKFPF